jgi:hypothetical protein
VEVIVSGDSETAIRLLNASPHLAKERAARGAIRQAPKEDFFDRIKHYINEGDTALHMAAAAKQTFIAAPTRTLLIRAGSLHCTAQCVIAVLPR